MEKGKEMNEKQAENVRVIVRCRPINKKEREKGCTNIIEIQDCSVKISNSNDPSAPSKTFTFDNAYNANAPTEAIYNDICYSLIENVLEGYNATIFAYGQTGCGKSYTMQGPETTNPSTVPTSQRGIISRSFDHIFEAISVESGVRYLALASYLEIYNENIRDLLSPNPSSTNLQLKEIPGEGVIVQGLSTHTIHNAKECEQLLELGAKYRMVGATLMNVASSRSHSIFTISLEQIEAKHNADLDTSPAIKKGKLNLVDLAGSERQNKTGAFGDRLKEATKINLSLSALGNVISALVDGKTKHIPYRDSKLTRLLQDSLGGNTKTLMIACISPVDYNYDETLSTLRYASRAKNIHNKPRINEDPKDAILREYQQEIQQLRKLLMQSNEKSSRLSPTSFDQKFWLEAEKEKLREQYESETIRLKNEHEEQQKEKEELVKDMERLKIHYENQLKDLAQKSNNNNDGSSNNQISSNNNNVTLTNLNNSMDKAPAIQQEALNRIEMIKNALIGGERAYDIQLKEKRYKRKIAAQRRLSALAHALSRVEQSSDRDLLQEHYTDIQQELKAKNESLKTYRQKIKALEREVTDLQSEFQFDRADYLETIRRLERNLKFYQQLLDKALPILRKDGKYWDPDKIQNESAWNDDLKRWKLPEDSMNRFKLPPAGGSSASKKCGHENATTTVDIQDVEEEVIGKKSPQLENEIIADSYFRPKRITELIHQNKEFMMNNHQKTKTVMNTNWINLSNTILSNKNNAITNGISNTNGMLTVNGIIPPTPSSSSSWLPVNLNNGNGINHNTSNNNGNHNSILNRTWYGGGLHNLQNLSKSGV